MNSHIPRGNPMHGITMMLSINLTLTVMLPAC